MFMKQKTGAGMKAAAVAAACILAAACFTTACQPTPIKNAVAGKTDVAAAFLNTANGAGRLPDYLGVSQTVNKSLTAQKGSKLVFDAQVSLPQANSLPVAEAKVNPFTEDQVKTIADAFFGPDAAYLQPSGPTKDYYTGRIQQLEIVIASIKQQISQGVQEHVNDIIDVQTGAESTQMVGKDDYENEITQYQKEISDDEELLKTAPDLSTFSGSLKYQDYSGISKDYNNPCIAAITSKNNERYMLWTVENGTHITIGKEVFMAPLSQPEEYFYNSESAPSGISITKDKAQNIAEELIQKIDSSFKLQFTCSGRTDDGQGGGVEAWQFIFTRSINGVDIPYESHAVDNSYGQLMFAPVQYENITVSVDGSGIVGLEWRSPMTIMKSINNNTALLPFEKIQEIAEEQLTNMLDNNNRYATAKQLTVTGIELGLTRINKPDDASGFYIIPVWDFYGKTDNQVLASDMSNSRYSLLTVNAMDGSIINRGVGY